MSDREKTIKGLWDAWKCMINKLEYKEAKKFFYAIDEAVSALKEQEWHMLTDDGVIHGWPGNDGQYLMTDGKDIWIDNYVDGVEDGIILDSGRDIRELTAWMYIPELPKKDRR